VASQPFTVDQLHSTMPSQGSTIDQTQCSRRDPPSTKHDAQRYLLLTRHLQLASAHAHVNQRIGGGKGRIFNSPHHRIIRSTAITMIKNAFASSFKIWGFASKFRRRDQEKQEVKRAEPSTAENSTTVTTTETEPVAVAPTAATKSTVSAPNPTVATDVSTPLRNDKSTAKIKKELAPLKFSPAPAAPLPLSTRSLKRGRPKSPTSPKPISPLIRRIPSIKEGEGFVTGADRQARESTPRSKRLRRESLAPGDRSTRENTAIPGVNLTATTIADDEDADDEAWLIQELHDDEGFSPQEAALFLRIRKRGLEPLMPAHWRIDFPTMPSKLFFPAEEDAVGQIDSITLEGTISATAAFQRVFNLGSFVRAKMEQKRKPEERILADLKRYVQWSVGDVRSHLKDQPPIYPRLALVSSGGRGPVHCETRMQRKLTQLATEVREENDRLAAAGTPRPDTASSTVYGLAVAGCVVALVTLDAANVDNPTARTMGILDFSDFTLDFWNSVAVALVVIAAREDELERNEFYMKNNLEKPPPEKKRDWERSSRFSSANDDIDA